MRRSMSSRALLLLALVALLSATTIITTTTHAQQLVFTQAPSSPWVGREHGGLNVIRGAFFTYNVGGTTLQAGTNSWILFGGTSSSYNARSTENDNDVWVSTNAGTTWFQVSGRYYDSTARQWIDAPSQSQSSYTTYRGSTSCSDSKSFLYVIGGEYDTNTTTVPVDDVYVSVNGGALWTKRGNSGLTPRAYPSCVIDSNRNVYVLNGILDYNDVVGDRRNPSNDVWVSSDFGATFRLVAQAPYSPRAAAASLFVVDKGLGNPKLIYVMGGWSELNITQSLKSDVWMSSDAGLSWTNIAALSAWGMRADMSVTSTELGFLVLYGGRIISGGSEWVWSNEVFISADGGVSWWGQAAGGVPAMAFAQLGIHGSDENLVIAGGGLPRANEPWSRIPTNVVFQSQLALSDTVETLSLFNVPGRVTTSCIGYYTCKNELAFTASTERADFTPRTRFTVHSLQQRHTVRLSSGSSQTLDPNSWVLFSGLTSYGNIARSPTDMWVSLDKGASWKQVGGVRNTSIPSSVSVFSNRGGACSFADQDDNLYVTGGVIWGSPKIMFNDTWVSGDVASSWSRRGTLVGYRAFHSCVADSDGNLYLMLGENEVYDYLADVQISRDRGASWSTLVSRTAIAARTAATLAVWPKRVNGGASDVFYLTAGMTNQLRNGNNDVFVSTDMATWSRVTSAAAWRARADATLAVSNNGILVMTGGRTVGTGAWYFFSDVWVSFDGGLAWDVIEDAMYAPRKFPSVFFTQDNEMVVVGGDNAALLNDVWVSRSFSDDQYLIRVSEAEGVAPCPQSSASSNMYASLSVCDALYGDKASGSSSSAGTNALIAIVVIVGVVTIGWVLYSLRAHGEVRIPCTERSCNCCNSALRRDTLFDDEFALHKGTGKFKQQSGMSRSLMDD